MKKTLEKTNVSLASERGFSFRPVNHDGASICLQDGTLQEIFPGIYVTVDPHSGIGLIEVNPAEHAAKLSLNGLEVLDIAQVSRRDVLSIDGKNYVFLKYMDAYFNKQRVRAQGSLVLEASPKVVAIASVARNTLAVNPVFIQPSLFKRIPKRTKILAAVTAIVTVASLSATLFISPGSSSPLEDKAASSKVVAVTSPQPVKKAPATINDLIGEEEKSPEAAPVAEPRNPEKPAAKENQVVKTEANPPVKQAAATSIKPTTPNKVKKPTATPAPAAPVSEAAMKSFESDFQEAVLIKGYDQERSVRILKQLQNKVPVGTALRQKIEKELR
jgi:hypothetical protein